MRLTGVLRARTRLALRTVLPARGRWSGLARSAAAVALGGLLASFIALGLAAMFETLSVEGAPAAEAARALSIAFTIALVAMLVFDLHESVATVVSDPDLELLRRAPVTPAVLFGLKLLDAVPRTAVLLIVVAVPATLAFHLSYPLPAWAWVLSLGLLAGLWAIPLGFGGAVAMTLLLRVPPRRARETLGVLSTLTIFLLWIANSFVIPRIALASEITTLRELLGALPTFHRLSPGHWAAEALGAAAGGDAPTAFGWALVVIVTGAAALGLAGWTAARTLERVQSRVAAGPGVRRRRTASRSAWPDAGESAARAAATPPGRRGVIRAILARDARLVARDWAILSDVLTAAILWMLLPLVAAPLYASGADGHTLVRVMLLALAVGLGYEVAARAIPLERRAVDWMRLVPVTASRWLAAKLAGAAIVSLALLVLGVASLTAGFGLPAGDAARVLGATLPALVVALTVGLWTGARHGNPEWTNPRAMLTLTGRLVATFLLVVQAGVWLGWFGIAELGGTVLSPGVATWAPVAAAVILGGIAWRLTVVRLERAG